MNKKVLLINPWIYDFAAYDFWTEPTGLLIVGALLKRSGFDVKLIDCLDRCHPSLTTHKLRTRKDGSGNYLKTPVDKPQALSFVPRVFGRYGISVDAFIDEIKNSGPYEMVLVGSSMTYWYPGVFLAINIAKEFCKNAPVALGGRYATLCNNHANENSGADVVYSGAIKSELSKIVEDITGEPCSVPDSFPDLPGPAHELRRASASAAIALSNGCPMRCTYCVSHKLAPVFEKRALDDVKRELSFLVEECGARHISFCDDALLFVKDELLIPLLEFSIEKKYKAQFYMPNAIHASMLDSATAKVMKKSNVSHIRIGLESADAPFQRSTGGKVNSQQFENAARTLRDAGFSARQIGAYILLGHPAHSADSVRDSIKLAKKCGVPPVMAEYSPIPGSGDFALAVEKFRHNPSNDPLLHNSSITQYQHPEIDAGQYQELKDMCRRIAAEI